MGKRLRLRDFFAGRKASPEGDGPPPETGEMIDATPEESGLDVEEALRECRRGRARIEDEIEELLRDEGTR